MSLDVMYYSHKLSIRLVRIVKDILFMSNGVILGLSKNFIIQTMSLRCIRGKVSIWLENVKGLDKG